MIHPHQPDFPGAADGRSCGTGHPGHRTRGGWRPFAPACIARARAALGRLRSLELEPWAPARVLSQAHRNMRAHATKNKVNEAIRTSGKEKRLATLSSASSWPTR